MKAFEKTIQSTLIVNPYAPSDDDDDFDCDDDTSSDATINNVSFPFQTFSLSHLDRLTSDGPWSIKKTTPFPFYDNSVSPPAVYTLLLVVIERIDDHYGNTFIGEGL